MKNIAKILTVIILTLSLVGCKDKAKEADTKEAETAAEVQATSVKYIADASASTIEWKGFKPTGTHNGTINIETGVFNVVDGNVDSGTFLINMKSIAVSDIPADNEGNGKLVGHLSNADFFDVEKFPSAAFEITGLSNVEGKDMLSGNLTLKDVKNNVTFPVTVATVGNELTITSEAFTIDRTKWNVQYGSKSIFDNLGDKFINDDIELKITVKATKS